jgi:hypothetical protein
MPSVTELRTKKDKNFASDLDEIAREGARRMLAQALEAEVADYIARNQERDARAERMSSATGRRAPARSL